MRRAITPARASEVAAPLHSEQWRSQALPYAGSVRGLSGYRPGRSVRPGPGVLGQGESVAGWSVWPFAAVVD